MHFPTSYTCSRAGIHVQVCQLGTCVPHLHALLPLIKTAHLGTGPRVLMLYFFPTTLTNKALTKLLKVEEASDVLGFALSFELISS